MADPTVGLRCDIKSGDTTRQLNVKGTIVVSDATLEVQKRKPKKDVTSRGFEPLTDAIPLQRSTKIYQLC